MILFASMANKHILDKNVGLLGLPYVMKQAFGNTVGNIFLIDCAIAIFVCCLAVQTATIRMLFSMARDNRLPAGSAVARVSGHRKVPIVPALVTGVLDARCCSRSTSATRARSSCSPSLAIIMFYIAYLGVTGADAGSAPAGRVAEARSRPVLLARALGAAGQHRGRGLRRARGDQHRLAAQRDLQLGRHAALVLAVVAVPVHRRGRDHRHDLLLHGAGRRRAPTCWRSTGPTCRTSSTCPRWERWRHDRRRRVRLCDRRRRHRGLCRRGPVIRRPGGHRVPARGRAVGRRRPADPAARGLDVPARLGLRLGLPDRAAGQRQQLHAPRPGQGARRMLVAQLLHRVLDAEGGPRRVGRDGRARAGARPTAGR